MTAHIGKTTYTCNLCDCNGYYAEDVKGYMLSRLYTAKDAEIHICEDCFKAIKNAEWEMKGGLNNGKSI